MNLPFARDAWPWAVVEVTADAGQELTRRIRDAYLASRAGVVGLVLRGVTAEAVDRVLDDVVDARDARLKGVVYLGDSDEAVLQAAAHAGLVVASSERFRSLLGSRGIRFEDAMTPHSAARELPAGFRGPATPARA